jgi:hypothetical protein
MATAKVRIDFAPLHSAAWLLLPFWGCRDLPMPDPNPARLPLFPVKDTTWYIRAGHLLDPFSLSINGHIGSFCTPADLKQEFGRPDSLTPPQRLCLPKGEQSPGSLWYGATRFLINGDSLQLLQADLRGLRLFLKSGEHILNKDLSRFGVKKIFRFSDSLPAEGKVELWHPDHPYRWRLLFERSRLRLITWVYPCNRDFRRKTR